LAVTQPVTELNDIQGILRSGYGSLPDAVYLLLRVSDRTKAKAWLAAIASEPGESGPAGRVTTAADLSAMQPAALQIALSASGLPALGLAQDIAAQFPRDFRVGLGSAQAEQEGACRRVGDVGANAPAHWAWGTGATVPDALLMLYANSGGLDAVTARVKTEIAGAFDIILELQTSCTLDAAGDRLENFGFKDGISQPELDWHGSRVPAEDDGLAYGNRVAAGEFLLGYANEYGLYADRPLLAPDRDRLGLLAPAEDNPAMRDLARNGSYLVFRQLEQDVGLFWRFLAAQDAASGGTALADLLVGRRLAGGAPLAMPAPQPIAGAGTDERDIRRNGFTFAADPDGLACPLGAHIRRANPRTADLPGGRQGLISQGLRMLGLRHGGPREDLVSAARFHRILRRGRAYGTFLSREKAMQDEGSEQKRGLHFIALNADITRQFAFVQNAWLMNPTFDGLSQESDPLLGNRLDFPQGKPTSNYTLPLATGPARRLCGLPQFVTMRGGAYFFLPGLRALRFLAQS